MPGLRPSAPFRRELAAGIAITLISLGGLFGPAHALTEPKKPQPAAEEPSNAVPGADQTEEEDDLADQTVPSLPMPDGLINKKATTDASKAEAEQPTVPSEIILDMTTLPEAVQKMRVALVEAAASGDIERLRPLLSTGDEPTQISIGDTPQDPIAALKSISGDPEGREILAILLDVISTGAALVDKGTPNATYVWPYFAEKRLDSLSPPEIVELYRIVTAGDVADMQEFGGYNFYRIGISPDGKWRFFVAGD